MPHTRYESDPSLNQKAFEALELELEAHKLRFLALNKEALSLREEIKHRDKTIAHYRLLEEELAERDERQDRLEKDNKRLTLQNQADLAKEAALRERIHALERELSAKDSTDETLKSPRLETKALLKEYSHQVLLLEKINQDQKAELLEMEKKQQALADDAEQTKLEQSDLILYIQELLEKEKTTELKLSNMSAQYEALALENMSIREAFADLNERSINKEEFRATTPDSSLEDEMNAANLQGDLQRALLELESINSANAALHESMRELRIKNTALSDDAIKLNDQIASLTTHERVLSGQLSAQQALVASALADAERTNVALATEVEQSRTLRAEIQQLQSMHALKIDALNGEALNRATTAAGEKALHADALLALEKKLVKSQEHTTVLEQNVLKLTGSLDAEQLNLLRLRAELDGLSNENKQLNVRLQTAELTGSEAQEKFQAKLIQQQELLQLAQQQVSETTALMATATEKNKSLSAQIALLQKDNKALLTTISSLESRIGTLTASDSMLREQLGVQTRRTQTAVHESLETKKALDAALVVSQDLRQHAETVQQAHALTVSKLQQLVADGSEKSTAAAKELVLEQTRHESAMAELQTQLMQSQASALSLSNTLKAQELTINKHQLAIEELSAQVLSLSTTKNALTLELADNKRLHDLEKQRLEQRLLTLTASLEGRALEITQATSALLTAKDENKALSEQIPSLQDTNVALSKTIQGLELKVSTLTANEALVASKLSDQIALTRATAEQLKDAQAQLSNALEGSKALTLKAEKVQQAHQLKVDELQQLVAAGTQQSAAAAKELVQERDRHGKALASLQSQLDKAQARVTAVSETLSSKTAELAKQHLANEQLTGRLSALQTTHQALIDELTESKSATEETLRVLNEQLGNQQDLITTAQEELATTKDALAASQRENQALIERIPTLEEDNAALKHQQTENLATLRAQAVLVDEKQAEIQRLTQLLSHYVEDKAKTALIAIIQACNNPVFLRLAANTESNAGLQVLYPVDLLEAAPLVNSRDPATFLPIQQAAIARLQVLQINALAALKDAVNHLNTHAALNQITLVDSNAALEMAGLNQNDVAALSDANAFQEIKDLALARLHEEQAVIAALHEKIIATDQVGDLYAISRAKDNKALEAIVFDIDHRPALIEPDAFKEFALAATQKLAERHRPDEAILPRSAKLIAQDKAILAIKRVIEKSKDREEFLDQLSAAENNDDLFPLEDLELKHIEALCDEGAYIILAEAANQRLIRLNQEYLRKNAGYLSPANYAATLDEDKPLLTHVKHVDSIQLADHKIRSELQLLGQIKHIHWFNPGFQAAAKKHATEMAAHFKALAKSGHVLLKYLKPLHGDLKELIASIPTDDALSNANPALSVLHIKAIKAHRVLLTGYLQHVETELERYKPVSRVLDGDRSAKHPILKQGLLKTLKEAAAEKKDLKLFTFNSNSTDHPMTERAKHFQSDYLSGPTASKATALIKHHASGPVHYDMVDRVGANTFREHVINSGKTTAGCFIEERGASFRAATTHSSELGPYIPDIKMTINKFPTLAKAPAPNTIAAHELVRARIEFALAFACQFLAESSGAPTAEHPIVLRGINTEELRYIWTALMILGKKVPYMTFDHTAIKVPGAAFYPQQELGRFYGFSNDSCYETCFKPHLSLVRKLTAGIIEVSEHKLGDQKGRRQTKRALEAVFSTYKNKLGTTLETLNDEQVRQERDDDLNPPR